MKVFIAGPRAVSKLNSDVIKRFDNIMNNNFIVLVGDANGVDKAIQKYYYEKGYPNVIVYATGERVRNNIGNWKTNNVEAPNNIRGFDFYALKDMQMALDADYGLMIWNGKSRGTFNNIINLVKHNKIVLLYLIQNRQFYKIRTLNDIEKLLELLNNHELTKIYLDSIVKVDQLTLEI